MGSKPVHQGGTQHPGRQVESGQHHHVEHVIGGEVDALGLQRLGDSEGEVGEVGHLRTLPSWQLGWKGSSVLALVDHTRV